MAEGSEIGGVKTRKLAFLIAFNLNNYRLQNATLTTMDGDDGTAGRGCKHNARIFFILEECLAFYYTIAFLYQHRGAHAHVIITHNSDMMNTGAGRYVLFRHARDWQIESFSDSKHVVSRYP